VRGAYAVTWAGRPRSTSALSAMTSPHRRRGPFTGASARIELVDRCQPGVVVPARRDEAEASMCAVERVSDDRRVGLLPKLLARIGSCSMPALGRPLTESEWSTPSLPYRNATRATAGPS
jgi:hypothetical protein